MSTPLNYLAQMPGMQGKVTQQGLPAPKPHTPANVDQSADQTDSTYAQLLEAMLAGEEALAAERYRGKRANYGGWGAVGMNAFNTAVAERLEDRAVKSAKEVGRLQADDRALKSGDTRRQAFEVIKAYNPDMDDGRAMTMAKAVEKGMLKLEELIPEAAEAVKMTDVNSLQTQITNTVGKDMQERSNAARDIYKYASGESPFGDHALIFRYMKFLDPTSTVREGEFATAAQSASVPEMVVQQYNRAVKGEKLTPEQRQDLVNTVMSNYPAYIEEYQQNLQPFMARAEQYGVDAGVLSVPKPWMPPGRGNAQQEQQPAAPPPVPPGYKAVRTEDGWEAVPL